MREKSTIVHDRTDRAPTDALGVEEDGSTWSRRRRVVFRSYSVVVALLTLAFFSFALFEAVLMWFPDDTIRSMDDGDMPGGLLAHRSHLMAIGLVAWTVAPAVWVQLRRPWRRVASLQVLVAMAVAGPIAYGLHGTLQDWLIEDVLFSAVLGGLVTLHPRVREVFRRPTFDRPMLSWAVVGTIPWAAYALSQAEMQFTPSPGDIHAGEEHWATAFMLAVGIVASVLAGASDNDGWRLPAWTSALVSTLFGVHSMVFPDLASGLSRPWALAAVAWGVGLAALTVRRTLEIRETRGPVEATSGS